MLLNLIHVPLHFVSCVSEPFKFCFYFYSSSFAAVLYFTLFTSDLPVCELYVPLTAY